MLKLTPPNYRFCPFCGTELTVRHDGEKERKICPKDHWVYYPHVVTSTSAIIIKDKKILLVKRNREPYRGTWMFPAGFVEFGEHPEETIKREVKEETGLNVTTLSLMTVVQSIDDIREPGHFVIVYRAQVKNGPLKTDEAENSDIKWFPLNDLPELGFWAHREVVKMLK